MRQSKMCKVLMLCQGRESRSEKRSKMCNVLKVCQGRESRSEKQSKMCKVLKVCQGRKSRSGKQSKMCKVLKVCQGREYNCKTDNAAFRANKHSLIKDISPRFSVPLRLHSSKFSHNCNSQIVPSCLGSSLITLRPCLYMFNL